MKLTIPQESLSDGLNVVGRAASTRATLPVLANILLKANSDGSLWLTATNLELNITCQVSCQVDKPGAITVPARTLTDLVAALSKGPVSLHLKKNDLEVAQGSAKATIKGIPAAEFPPMPEVDPSQSLQLPAAEFKALVQRVVFDASTDEYRPILTGVLVIAQDSAITLAAADGFRLSESKLALAQPVPKSFRCVVPARAFAELARITGEAETLAICLPPGRGQIVFSLPGASLVSQLIDGNYPDYLQIIPRAHATRQTANTAALLKACKQAEIFARENGKAAHLAIKPGAVLVTGHSEESGSTGSSVEAVLDGKELEIAFNVGFLREALSAIRTPSVVLDATTSASPGVLRPVGEDGFLHVIMPLHIGS